MERKLATIQRISNLEPIVNADAIEVASVLGWKIVVKRGDFKVNDLCVYCEIDSIIPPKPEFDFLKAHNYRIRTIKLRGQISQGICFPLPDSLPEAYRAEGSDVTELLGITKYEPVIPACLGGLVKGNFPCYVPKTDETRIQSSPDLMKEFLGLRCYVTVKVDGTSATFMNKDGEVDVCGRNWAFKPETENTYMEIFKRYKLEEKLKSLGNFALQGEIAGNGIQKNRLQLKRAEFFVFNVYDINQGRHCGYQTLIDVCRELELKSVPVLIDSFLWDESVTIESLLKMAEGVYEGTKNPREGIVIRPLVPVYSPTLGGRLSVKVLNNSFLLKEE